MNDNETSNLEVRRIRRMLKQMYSLAEHASLTGALSDGAEDAIAAYNRIIQRLIEIENVPTFLFAPLPLDASFDRLGVASKLLEGYLSEDESEKQSRGGSGGPKIIFGNNNGDFSGLEELKDIGRLIRENLPEFLRHRHDRRSRRRSHAPQRRRALSGANVRSSISSALLGGCLMRKVAAHEHLLHLHRRDPMRVNCSRIVRQDDEVS